MLIERIPGRQLVAALLLVIALVSAGTVPVSAHSICDEHKTHTHGKFFWERKDAFMEDGWGIGPLQILDHWVLHQNSSKDWCDD